jgi:hypothetical protein
VMLSCGSSSIRADRLPGSRGGVIAAVWICQALGDIRG